MPLTKSGKKVIKSTKKTYGAKKGEDVFYAMINAKKKGSRAWHLKKKVKKSTKK